LPRPRPKDSDMEVFSLNPIESEEA
jgi:hypothetical protein